MALTETGLTVESYQEILAAIIASEQSLISETINVDEDTLLGQLNMIMASRLSLTNEGIQDIYDARDIYKAEGKALDDIVSWLGITRQSAAETSGETYLTGVDGTIIIAGSLIQNGSTKDVYATDATIQIAKEACRQMIFSVPNDPVDNKLYNVTIQGVIYSFTTATPAETKEEILAALVILINNALETYTAEIDSLDATRAVINSDTNINTVVNPNLRVEEVTVAGNITGLLTGTLPAPASSLTVILSPQGGWTSTSNPSPLSLGRDLETDFDLRLRAINSNAASGTATLDSILGSLLDIEGVSSAAVNEKYVSECYDGGGDYICFPVETQNGGSIHLVIAGGQATEAERNLIAQTIWDTKPAGVEVWSLEGATQIQGDAIDLNGDVITIYWNSPDPVNIDVSITYAVYDANVYPSDDEDAKAAIQLAVIEQGNALNAGEDVVSDEFESDVYCAVGGIYKLIVQMGTQDFIPPITPEESITIELAPNEEALFTAINISVINVT